MTEYQIELVKYRLQKSEDTLNDAVYLAIGKKWNSSANRLYYSAYYSVQALLMCHELSSKTHKGARQLFHQNFIQNNTIEKELGDLYTQLFEARQESDYQDFSEQTEESINYFISKTRLFISQIKEFIELNCLNN
ncbi:MAG: HEPN domain-containing protein [Bacteroidetes bacterium]|nr:HEPN domain-containing protein [Bacteroidota bacterium]